MKIKIISGGAELTSAKGNKYKKAKIEEIGGKTYEEVAIFSSFSLYAQVAEGAEIEGEIKINEKDYNGKKSFNLEDETKPQIRRSPTAINAAMDKKEKSIDKFQQNKEESIKMASIMRDATLLTVAQANSDNDIDLKVAWEQWRKWLEAKWELPFE